MNDRTGSDKPTAVMGRRCLAWLIDLLIIATMMIAGTIVIWLIFRANDIQKDSYATVTEAENECNRITDAGELMCFSDGSDVYILGSFADLTLFLLLSLALTLLLLMVIFPGWKGWSLGKLLMGLRIVQKDSLELAGFGRNITRGLLWAVDGFPFVPLVGLITSLCTLGNRRVGDLVAGTLVVHKSDVGLSSRNEPFSVEFSKPTGATTADPVDTVWKAPDEAMRDAPVTSATYQKTPAETAASSDGETTNSHEGSKSAVLGVDAPHWDEARNTYIQWDPGLEEWMEWSESRNRWIPISR